MSVHRRYVVTFRLSLALALLMTVGCTRFDVLNAVGPQCGVTSMPGYSYGPLPRQKLDVYTPDNVGAGRLPVVIFFYGGEWSAGERHDYRFAGKALASRGFVAVLPDYRLYPQVRFPAFVDDAARATRWVHDHIASLHGDPSRIFLMGHSAGAHIASLLCLDPHYLKAQGLSPTILRGFVGISGPYEFIPYPEDRNTFNMPAGQHFPDPAIETSVFARDPSNVASAPPMLLMQGCRDTTVKPVNAIRLATAVNDAGGHATVKVYCHQAHGQMVVALATFLRGLAPVLDDATAFMHAHDQHVDSNRSH